MRDGHGAPVVSAAQAKPGMAIDLTFHDGARAAVIDGKPAKKMPAAPPSPARAKDQGDLF